MHGTLLAYIAIRGYATFPRSPSTSASGQQKADGNYDSPKKGDVRINRFVLFFHKEYNRLLRFIVAVEIVLFEGM